MLLSGAQPIDSVLPGFAQGLKQLDRAKEISVGQFPNGITYYLVTNKAAYGYADYALVQKGVPEETKFRGELLSLSHFDGQKPYRFLASRGVGYKDFGYVRRGEDCPAADAHSQTRDRHGTHTRRCFKKTRDFIPKKKKVKI